MMKKMDKKAFTLIELLVVIAVVGILVLLGAPRFTGYTQKAELIRIQHDTKVMEEEIGTVLINGDDDFNKWENNMKDLNQLAQEDKLFEKEGHVTGDVDDSHLVANRTVDLRKHASKLEPSNKTNLNVGGELYSLNEDLSISETYKVIPERYKDEINSELKGTFYANSDGKVYYEHVKSLSRILTKSKESEEEPEEETGYSDEEINDLVERHEHIPVATAEELDSIRNGTTRIYGEGTKWRGTYTGGLDKHYVQVKNIDLSEYSGEGWNPIGNTTSKFIGIYDGGNYVITNLVVNGADKERQGLFGFAEGATIRNASLEGINVTGGQRVGGLVGEAWTSTIENSYATGPVTGTGQDYVGGLVGRGSNSNINNSYATGPVVGRRYAGGLVGKAAYSEISNSYAEGPVTGESKVGGLVGGTYDATIENAYATGKVIGSGTGGSYIGSQAGGLVGEAVFDTTINNSYATGDVMGGYTSVGGLVGSVNKGPTISNSYATGSVESSANGVGGLVGTLQSDSGSSTISKSYATGPVTGVDKVGGLVGSVSNSSTTIENSYATGEVTGKDYVGGFAGDVTYSTINNSYAIGSVTGDSNVGGFVGDYYGYKYINNSYWDTETTVQSTSDGGSGKTTDEMKKADTYSAWDTDVWNIVNGNYPTLR